MTATSVDCWVYGEDVAEIFTVKISTTNTVDDLKEAIKEKTRPRFDDVGAHSLRIYTIPLVEDRLEDDLNKWSPAGQLRRNARGKVSALKDLLVIVTRPEPDGSQAAGIPAAAPNMTLNCWVYGQPAKCIFPVKISNKELVGTLKEVIKAKKSVKFRDIDADTLALYKVSLPVDPNIDDTLKAYVPDPKQYLPPLEVLSDIFLDAPLSKHIHVVIEAPISTRTSGTRTPPSPAEEDDMLAPLIWSFKTATTITSKSLTPSQAAKSKEYLEIQSGDQRILDCRCAKNNPVNTIAPPIQLFHPAFAFFSSKASDPKYHVSDEALRDTRDLMAQFTLIHSREGSRRNHLRSSLGKVIGRPLASLNNSDKTSPDFVVTGKCGSSQTYLVVVEDKNEFGDGGSDPSVQASFSFQRIFCQEENAELCLKCCCPVFAIAHAGPWLTVMGCVITGNCIIQRLTDFLWIPVHSSLDDEQFLRIARVFCALRESVGRLDSWYEDIVKDVLPFSESSPYVPHSRFFPSPNAYLDGDKLVLFEYLTPLEHDVSCVTYRAKTREDNPEDNPKDVVIKFVTSYGADAHQYMASAGHSPQLLYYGRIDVKPDMPSYGDLRMVVMEYVNGHTLQKAHELRNVPQNFEPDLRGVLQRLHDANYVYGDLRQPNVMVTAGGQVQLIDFDWAGKSGEAKYPVAISSSIAWPIGVQGLALIRKEHDEAMLKTLLASIRSTPS